MTISHTKIQEEQSAENGFPLVPRLLTVSITERCNASCHMCVVGSHPHRKGTEADEIQALRWLDEAASLDGLRGICLVGGEPFLRRSLVARLCRRARRAGLSSSAVTNCFWAEDKSAAMRVLYPLRGAGLSRITVSADQFHATFVPVERVDYAIAAAQCLGLR